jgi:hypothetical protein
MHWPEVDVPTQLDNRLTEAGGTFLAAESAEQDCDDLLQQDHKGM